MDIQINPKNTAAIEAALAAANGKANSFAITGYSAVADLARHGEAMLEQRGVPLKVRLGCILVARPGGPSANAYRYAAPSTEVTLYRGSANWRLVGIASATVYPRSLAVRTLHVTPAAHLAIIRRAMAGVVLHDLSTGHGKMAYIALSGGAAARSKLLTST